MQAIFFPLHILTLSFVVITILRADHLGFGWMRGTTKKLDALKIKKLHTYMWAGLLCMIATGLCLFWPLHEYLLSRVQFFVKMGFVFTLIVNALVIGKMQNIATTHEWKELPWKQKLPLLVSGAVSTLAWLGAFAGAFYINEY